MITIPTRPNIIYVPHSAASHRPHQQDVFDRLPCWLVIAPFIVVGALIYLCRLADEFGKQRNQST